MYERLSTDKKYRDVEFDKKATPSDKVFNIIGLTCGIISVTILLACLIIFSFWPKGSAYTFIYAFYPLVILLIVGTFCSAAQLLRNRYLSSLAGFILNVMSIIAVVVILIVQAVVNKQVLIIPFIYF